MESHYDKERREFVRIRCEVAIRYKFICRHRTDNEMMNIYEGKTTDMSASGLLLNGILPRTDWAADLLLHKIVVGVNIWLPDSIDPVKALTRVAWIETVDEKTLMSCYGLNFREITTVDRDKIFRFVLKEQLPNGK